LLDGEKQVGKSVSTENGIGNKKSWNIKFAKYGISNEVQRELRYEFIQSKISKL
jgi:hypothetical protein